LKETDWEDIGKRLLAFTIYKCRFFPRDQNGTIVLPAGHTPEDIASMVILKTIQGKRSFDSTKGELLPTLQAQVRSEISNLRESLEGKSIPSKSQDIESVEEEGLDAEGVHIRKGQIAEEVPENKDPETTIIYHEDDAEEGKIQKERIDGIFAAVEGDPGLGDVLNAIISFDGNNPKPRHIAEYLGISVDDVYSRIKRLKRKVQCGPVQSKP
jgi:hypothetical protein